MTDMIERLAKVVRDEIAHPHDGEFMVEGGFRGTNFFLDIARSVLEEMRDPADDMGNGLCLMPNQPYKPGSHSASDIWRAMIDRAINAPRVSDDA